MPNRRASFSQSDVTRALKAAEKAGQEVAAVRIEKATGDIVLTIGEHHRADANPCDELLS